MGIYIKGMKMPKNCRECRFGSLESCETEPTIIRCIVLNRFTHEVDWHEYCPLVEVKPHGRLIDADALITVTEMVDGKWKTYIEVFEVEDAPTIIESEGEDGNI